MSAPRRMPLPCPTKENGVDPLAVDIVLSPACAVRVGRRRALAQRRLNKASCPHQVVGGPDFIELMLDRASSLGKRRGEDIGALSQPEMALLDSGKIILPDPKLGRLLRTSKEIMNHLIVVPTEIPPHLAFVFEFRFHLVRFPFAHIEFSDVAPV
jgi:hypothetical protein